MSNNPRLEQMTQYICTSPYLGNKDWVTSVVSNFRHDRHYALISCWNKFANTQWWLSWWPVRMKLERCPYVALCCSELRCIASVRLGELRYSLEHIYFLRSHFLCGQIPEYLWTEPAPLVPSAIVHISESRRFRTFTFFTHFSIFISCSQNVWYIYIND
jgi:hypothetical protein